MSFNSNTSYTKEELQSAYDQLLADYAISTKALQESKEELQKNILDTTQIKQENKTLQKKNIRLKAKHKKCNCLRDIRLIMWINITVWLISLGIYFITSWVSSITANSYDYILTLITIALVINVTVSSIVCSIAARKKLQLKALKQQKLKVKGSLKIKPKKLFKTK